VNDPTTNTLSGDLLRHADHDRVRTVILAGGMGTRLRPYTSILPKPLLPLGDRSILELLMKQLARKGFRDITLSVGHLAHLIEAVLGNGAGRDVEITYVREDLPLGTAGSLRIVPGLDRTFLMLNGDVVTALDYRELVRHHRANGNVVTIATRQREVRTEYGVLDVDASSDGTRRVVGYQEKPILNFRVSMGVYVLEPQALDFVPEAGYFDFPDLVHALLEADARVGSYDYDGFWLDIGRYEDYEQAIAMWEAGELHALFADETEEPELRFATRNS
jgi:NDP-sugar pyrophosphorylase family protein